MATQYTRVSLVTFVVALSLSPAIGETFYIKTTPTQPCPSSGYPPEHCLTLQQYINRNLSVSDRNIFLELQSGQHNITVVSDIRVQSANTFQVQGVDATINCVHANRSRFLIFENVDTVTVSGVFFNNCKGWRFYTVSAVTIRDCSFKVNGELILYATSAVIINSTFQDGYGLQLGRSSILITSSQFLNISSYDKPAPGSPLCSRYSERARRGGGAVFGFESTITVNECNFTRNTVPCGGGGAILVENTRLRINNSRFTENTASIIGGAVYAYENVTEIHSSIFDFNSVTGMSRSAQPVLSKGGGAIFVSSPSSKIPAPLTRTVAHQGEHCTCMATIQTYQLDKAYSLTTQPLVRLEEVEPYTTMDRGLMSKL